MRISNTQVKKFNLRGRTVPLNENFLSNTYEQAYEQIYTQSLSSYYSKINYQGYQDNSNDNSDFIDDRFLCAGTLTEVTKNDNRNDSKNDTPEDSKKIIDFSLYQSYIDQLPTFEQDIINLYFYKKRTQSQIAFILNRTQGAISHRIGRIKKRINFLKNIPKVNNLDSILQRYFTDFEIDIIQGMIKTTCQSATAKLINKKYNLTEDNAISQTMVRHNYNRCIERLEYSISIKETDKNDLNSLLCLLKYIQKNLYCLHEVRYKRFQY